MHKGRIFLGVLLVVSLCIGVSINRPAPIAVIDWKDVHQTIDGFGGAAADFLKSLTPAQADFFFTTAGIGLSILRTQIIPDQATCDADFHHGACSDSNGQILNGELASAKMAAARGAIVFSTPWSPPGSFKSNGSFTNGGSLLPAHYSEWAREIATYVTMMEQNGVPLYAVSVQNEPDLTTNYGSCIYTAQEIHDFVPYLYSALQSARVATTKIIIAEESSWSFGLTSIAMADSKVAPYVGILAAHGYHGEIRPYNAGTARLWQTEDSSQSSTYDGSMTDGIRWAQKIHNYLSVANVNAWIWWFLTDMPNQGEGADNAALTDLHGNVPKRAYVTAQWSKFVRPGWSRVGVNYSGPVQISAFKDSGSHSFAIIAINPMSRAVRQTFSWDGFVTRSVVPWLTTAKYSIAPQTLIQVNGSRFTSTLPGSSVTTFVGTFP